MITCVDCSGLDDCAPALEVYAIGRANEEAGGKALSVSMTCPDGLGKSRGRARPQS